MSREIEAMGKKASILDAILVFFYYLPEPKLANVTLGATSPVSLCAQFEYATTYLSFHNFPAAHAALPLAIQTPRMCTRTYSTHTTRNIPNHVQYMCVCKYRVHVLGTMCTKP